MFSVPYSKGELEASDSECDKKSHPGQNLASVRWGNGVVEPVDGSLVCQAHRVAGWLGVECAQGSFRAWHGMTVQVKNIHLSE